MASLREGHRHVESYIALASTLCALSVFIVGVRCWARVSITRQGMGADDIFIIAGMAVTIIYTALTCFATRYGLGYHLKDIHPEARSEMLKLIYITPPIYLTLVWLCKTSVALLYLRLFPPVGSLPKLCWAYIIVNTIIWISCGITGIMLCQPIEYFWNKDITAKHPRCLDMKTMYIATGSLAVIMDLLALAIPLPSILKLRIAKRQKFVIASLFASGGFVSIASFLRIQSLVTYKVGTVYDLTWELEKSEIWTVLEINLGIMTICAPVCKPFFTGWLWPKVKTYGSNGSGCRGHDDSNGKSSDSRGTKNGDNDDVESAELDELGLGHECSGDAEGHNKFDEEMRIVRAQVRGSCKLMGRSN